MPTALPITVIIPRAPGHGYFVSYSADAGYLGLKYFSALIRIFFTMRNIMGDGSGGRDDNMSGQETDPRHLLPRLFASNLRIFLP